MPPSYVKTGNDTRQYVFHVTIPESSPLCAELDKAPKRGGAALLVELAEAGLRCREKCGKTDRSVPKNAGAHNCGQLQGCPVSGHDRHRDRVRRKTKGKAKRGKK